MKKVRIGDVAREAGVSLGTVSNALNHPDKVRPETLDLINETIARLGYVPNQAARQLAGGGNRMFGLVLPRLDHGFSLQIANGAQVESREHGYDLLIASAGNDDILTNHYMSYFTGARMAGVLVQPMASSSWEPPVDSPTVPTVYLDIHGRSYSNCIAADNEAQGRLIVQHAAACGARRVVVIGEVKFMQLTLRVYGMREAASATGVEVEFIGRGDWNDRDDGFRLGYELACRPLAERPDFVIGLTDMLAAGAMDGIAAAGLSVPGDILVAGCDGNPFAWSGAVTLTTIASPGYEIGRRGVRALLDQIEGTRQTDEPEGLVPPSLIERASTAVNRANRRAPVQYGVNLGEYLGGN